MIARLAIAMVLVLQGMGCEFGDPAGLAAVPGPGATEAPPAEPFDLASAELDPAAGPLFDGSAADDWVLVFEDEFSGTRLDRAKWHTCYWWSDDGCTNEGNNELQWYRPSNLILRYDVLWLRARAQRARAYDGRSYAYTSGMITSGRNTSDISVPSRFAFCHGYAEIRAKVPAGRGLWPAFWLLPDNNRALPEIDVMEVIGQAPRHIEMNFHYRDGDGRRRRTNGSWNGPDFSRGWHRFGIDWRPDMIVWYVDGKERFRFDEREHLPTIPMYLLANLAVGGDWPGPPDASTSFPSDFAMDYVRVWRRAGEQARPLGVSWRENCAS